MSNPLKEQIAGNHYIGFAIQPAAFIHANQIGFLAGCVIKYVCRYKLKNGKEDLQKAKHYLEILEHLEYGGEENVPEDPVEKDDYLDLGERIRRQVEIINTLQRTIDGHQTDLHRLEEANRHNNRLAKRCNLLQQKLEDVAQILEKIGHSHTMRGILKFLDDINPTPPQPTQKTPIP